MTVAVLEKPSRKTTVLEVQNGLPPLQPGDRLSRAEFERRYAAHPEIAKAELIEGVVYMPSPARYVQHSAPHFAVIGWLFAYCASTPGVDGGDNSTLRLDLENEPQPDVLLRLSPQLGGRSFVAADGYLEGVPELIVEIAASTASYDMNQKRQVYARNGVPEYLVYLSYDKRIVWYVLGDEGYTELLPGDDGILASEIFPGLWLDPQALLRGDMAGVLAALQRGLASPEHKAFVERLTPTS